MFLYDSSTFLGESQVAPLSCLWCMLVVVVPRSGVVVIHNLIGTKCRAEGQQPELYINIVILEGKFEI